MPSGNVTTKELNVRVTATDQTRGVMKDIARQAREVERATAARHKVSRDRMEAIGRVFGMGGELGEAGGKIGQGGALAVAGTAVAMDMVGRSLSRWTATAAEMAEQYQAGKVSVAEMVEETAKGLPILGGWISAGRNIRGMIDGSAEAVRQMNASIARQTALIDSRQQVMKASAEATASYVRTAAATSQRRRMIGLTGTRRDRTAAEIGLAGDLDAIEADIKNRLSPHQERIDPMLREKRDELKKLPNPVQYESLEQYEARTGGPLSDSARRGYQEIYDAHMAAQNTLSAARQKIETEIRDLEDQLADAERDIRGAAAGAIEQRRREYGDQLREIGRAEIQNMVAGLAKGKAFLVGTVRELAKRAKEEMESHRLEQRDHESQLTEVMSIAAVARLRAQGQHQEADQAQMKAALAHRLQLIKDDINEQIRQQAHRAPELRRWAAERAQAEVEIYQAGLDEMKARREQAYQIDQPGVHSGDVRLITGMAGSRAAAASDAIKPAKETAEASKKAEGYLKRITEQNDALIAHFQSQGVEVEQSVW